jgi:hypothetical protein
MRVARLHSSSLGGSGWPALKKDHLETSTQETMVYETVIFADVKD